MKEVRLWGLGYIPYATTQTANVLCGNVLLDISLCLNKIAYFFSTVNSSTQNIMKNHMKRLESSLERKFSYTDKAMIHKIYEIW